ncbi:chromosome segregation protein SMC [Leptolyngbya ohadii]|uniref:chromosome segregation protein SMC n=1 Tax=Leptolyngbya ohadii TaxID=1962290 RepID=UPI000B5A0B8E|nr:chromosome segregation protein SMC [Leptolyngbya ohadii]
MYIKRVELSHFKSFGGTTAVPLLPGFTVISGPNGSGKSNILDALLFALGLSSSKGMRAERLPDLVNQSQMGRGRSMVEASVTVTFALEEEDWIGGDRDTQEEGNAEQPDGNPEFVQSEDLGAEAENHQQNGHAINGHATNGRTNGNTPASPALNGHLREWNVTRKLRVTQQGTYTSSYAINGVPCTLTELHEQLHKFRIYPEGYNVVLQGDVTSIISMNPRERREIIDELAGVAAFDRKIIQAREKLDAVKEREEKFRIVERELMAQRDRLSQDRIKAEKYQRLKADLQLKSHWEAVLVWQGQVKQADQLRVQIAAGDRTQAELQTQIAGFSQQIQAAVAELDRLNARVKALGEDELLALQATLATREAELRQLQRQEQTLLDASKEIAANLEKTQREIQEQIGSLEQVTQEKNRLETETIVSLQAEYSTAQQSLEASREAASSIASASEAWVQEQTALRHTIESILQTLEPQRTEQARLQERVTQLRQKIAEQTDTLGTIAAEIAAKQTERTETENRLAQFQREVDTLILIHQQAERELQTQQETQARLLREQREKQRQLDKLEAQIQAVRETQGTGTTQMLLEAGLPGICGVVAQLGRVDPQFQLALEIAAGGRLAQLVVEDDGVAAAGIALLKQKRAGRATFLPLNKIRPPQVTPIANWKRPEGFIDYASNLIECDDRYKDVFAYVFGGTVVFQTLEAARRHMGQYRIVTLDGELLEPSGAMTGGSFQSQRGSLHFGTVEPAESAEVVALRDRLREIDRILDRCQEAIDRENRTVRQQGQALQEARQQYREIQIQTEQIQHQLAHAVAQEGQLRTQISHFTQELTTAQERLHVLEQDLPQQEAELNRQRQILAELEQSQTHSEWQQMQAIIRSKEAELSDRQLALQSAMRRLQDLETQRQRIQEKTNQLRQRLQECRTQQADQLNQRSGLSTQQTTLRNQITEAQSALANLDQTLAAEKQVRDRAERQLREQQNQQQQLEWQVQKLHETQQTRRQELTTLQEQIETQRDELPDPLPEIPETITDLTALQHELRSLQKRLQAMEPVNMLALEEYDRTQARLEELSQKLSTLDEERTELLLRIENFTTLRQRAFKEAFDAVNQNFQAIFAELSDGDGYLQLDNPQDPFASGLNLVAHPKGKPVQRLASMSGGEKSLTALSFIFALQRYRPSPFYAFDEVDMFLDGANVERLSKMIKHQTQQAQFIVVSLRRPMIEAAQRTIGVTQARGAYTQVLGIDLQAQPASS